MPTRYLLEAGCFALSFGFVAVVASVSGGIVEKAAP